jgi:predicted naringenin-chalcone synthase
MGFVILGLGTALPATAVSQAESIQVAQQLCTSTAEQAEMLPSLYRHSGIATRHLAFDRQVVVDILEKTQFSGSAFLPHGAPGDRGPSTRHRMEHYMREAGPLASRACEQALAESGLGPTSITHLVTVSCTGFSAPGIDIGLIHGLGLRPTVQRTHVGFMGCHGALNGLRVARALTGSDRDCRVLLCAVELCGVHFYYGWNPKQMVASALFADGAAAVMGAGGGNASESCWQAVANGACVFPDSTYAMTWDIGDHGFEMTLSTRVPELIAGNLRPWIEAWLAENRLTLAEVGSWAIHPGGPRILQAAEDALGLDRQATQASREVLAECGNMSSPTVLFILDRLRRRGAARPCVALGFGPGLAAEAALFR